MKNCLVQKEVTTTLHILSTGPFSVVYESNMLTSATGFGDHNIVYGTCVLSITLFN